MSVDNLFDTALARVRDGLDNQRMAQAYLLVGPLRTHGIPMARQILQSLYCEKTPQACETCISCRRIAERTHPDVFWMEPQMKSRIISIDAVRDLIGDLMKTAFEGGWKAAVIVGADRLGTPGKAEGGNAILKVLEEPPEKTLFLMLTDSPDSVLSTILSRCQRITLSSQRIDREAVWFKSLEQILILPAETGATLNGMIRSGRIQALLEERRDQVEKEETEIVKAGELDRETREALVAARVEIRVREERMEMLRVMESWYRDLLVVHLGIGTDLMFADHAVRLRGLAEGMTFRQALDNIEAIENMQRQFTRNIKEDVVFTMGFARLSP
jgi:DNA polymerase-3 subunit delta'